MESIERWISELLRRYPGFREFIKLNYQRFMYYLHRFFSHEKNYIVDSPVKNVSPGDGEFFFGYYGISPWDLGGRFILTLKVPFADRHPGRSDRAVIAMIDTLNDNDFITLSDTNTWSLQQGAMLQWLGPDFKDRIIYNDMINGNYVSIIYNVFTAEKRVLDLPVYTVSSEGKYALSLNFSRLQRMRPGYGYSLLPDRTEGEFYPEDDGIYILDIEKNESNLIISLQDIVNCSWEENFKGLEHRINHLDFNPEGSRFSFIHRYKYKGETHSRLFTADINGDDIYCLADDKMVSHTCWKNNRELLAWARQKGIGDRYFLFRDKSGNKEILADGILTEDGHPSYSPDGRYILTDTYPDRFRYSKLIIYDTETDKRHDIGRFFATFKYKEEYRCDLHPRWSRDGKKICFDSVHEGKRKLYIMDNLLYRRGESE